MATTFDGLNLNRFAVFVAVVEAGSMTSAAARLGMGKTIVSTHIQRLEQELGVSLLVRNTRRMALTEGGEAFFELAKTMLQDARQAVEALEQNVLHPTGTLCVSAPIDFGGDVVTQVLVKLQQRYADLKVELITSDRFVDLIGEGIDAAIRLGSLANSNMRAVKLGKFDLWLVCSPQVLAKHPIPKQPRDLTTIPLITFSVLSNSLTWTFKFSGKAKQIVQFRSSLTVNSSYSVRAAALAGAGLAVIPDFAVAEDIKLGRLVRVLPKWELPSQGIYVVFPETRFIPLKVRVLIDAFRDHIKHSEGIHKFV